MIEYTIDPAEPLAHRLTIHCHVPKPNVDGQQFRLPTWIPGSYLIREFARHVVFVRASQNGVDVPIRKINKHTWQCAALKTPQALTLTWQVHAWDLSVRGAHFDQRHAFINGCAVFPEVIGFSESPCRVSILPPPLENGPKWKVFTTLPEHLSPSSQSLASFSCPNYATLIDHPIEMGDPAQYQVLAFEACGTPHRMVLRGAGQFHAERLRQDLQKICSYLIQFFGEPAPFERYDFLTTLTGDGYGGLEHANCTALLANRDDLPALSMQPGDWPSEGYTRFLGLCAHEYFHAWNVKRIQDAALVASALDQEAYTSLLWFFEGFTSYYDDLTLVRCGLINESQYILLLEKTLRQVLQAPGHTRQTLANSSFDAWIKYYRPDENTPNSVVSYYAKGSLVALSLDLTLREQGLSCDQWMQSLWQTFGKTLTPLTRTDLLNHLQQFAGESIAEILHHWVESDTELPLTALLATVGLQLTEISANGIQAWGLRTTSEQGLARITHVIDGSLAQQAGLAPGDLWVAANGQRITSANLEENLSRLIPQKSIQLLGNLSLHVFREEKLLEMIFSPNTPPLKTYSLSLDKSTPTGLDKRDEWIGAFEINSTKNGK